MPIKSFKNLGAGDYEMSYTFNIQSFGIHLNYHLDQWDRDHIPQRIQAVFLAVQGMISEEEEVLSYADLKLLGFNGVRPSPIGLTDISRKLRALSDTDFDALTTHLWVLRDLYNILRTKSYKDVKINYISPRRFMTPDTERVQIDMEFSDIYGNNNIIATSGAHAAGSYGRLLRDLKEKVYGEKYGNDYNPGPNPRNRGVVRNTPELHKEANEWRALHGSTDIEATHLTIRFNVMNGNIVQGAPRSEKLIHNKYVVVNPKSETLCGFTAANICANWVSVKNIVDGKPVLLFNKITQNEQGKEIKKTMLKKYRKKCAKAGVAADIKPFAYSNQTTYQLMAEHFKCTVITHDNLFQVSNTYQYNGKITRFLKKSKKHERVIELWLRNGHCLALINKKDIELSISAKLVTMSLDEIQVEINKEMDKRKAVEDKTEDKKIKITTSNTCKNCIRMKCDRCKNLKNRTSKCDHKNNLKISPLCSHTMMTKSKFDDDSHDLRIAAFDYETTSVKYFDPVERTKIVEYMVGYSLLKEETNVREIYGNSKTRSPVEADFDFYQFVGMMCSREMLTHMFDNRQRLDGYTIYAHNGAKFDVPKLMEAVDAWTECPWKVKGESCIEQNGGWIKYTLYVPAVRENGAIVEKEHRITFLDSIRMAASSLKAFATDLGSSFRKEDLDEDNKHMNITIDNWYEPKRLEALKHYHMYDCLTLIDCMFMFSFSCWENEAINMNITSCVTSATLAKKWFYKKHYDEINTPIYLMSRKHDQFIRKGYFGGRVECFRMGKIPQKAYYYDFTSLYPDVGRQDLPYGMPEDLDEEYCRTTFDGTVNEYFKWEFGPEGKWGMFRVSIDSSNVTCKRGLHCVKDDKGRLLFPDFKIASPTSVLVDTGVIDLEAEEVFVDSASILRGTELGYQYKIYEGIQFAKGPIMKRAFEDAVKEKCLAKKAGKHALVSAMKIIANSLYGVYGMNLDGRDTVKIAPKDKMEYRKYYALDQLVNVSLMGDHHVMRVIDNLNIKDVNVAIASAITAYARMKTHSLIAAIESAGYEVFYCDTDSVITDCPVGLIPELRDVFIPDWKTDAGADLGSLKNECYDKICKKYGRDVANKQRELDGGECYFDEGAIIAGAKSYAVVKTLGDGRKVECMTMKGYKRAEDKFDVDGTPTVIEYKLTYEAFERLIAGEYLTQYQKQFRNGKSAYISETLTNETRHVQIQKSIRMQYTKGHVQADNSIVAMVVLN